jgi:hypothetical protein
MTRWAGKKLGRREAVLSLGSFAALCLSSSFDAGCGGTVPITKPVTPSKAFGGPVEIWSWFDLPDDPRSRELSGIAWDDAKRLLWAVQDESSSIVSIVPDRELKKWSFGSGIELKLTFPLDLEGIVVMPDGFVVASEIGPRVLEVDRSGKLRRDIALPAHFAKARENKSIESLTMSPGGRYIFTTTEAALISDGANPTPSAGTRLRILRVAMDGGETVEHAYATDPLPHASGDYGVADLAALSSDDLLVLERGWTRGSGNTARVYRVSLADTRSSCLDAAALLPDGPVMEKRLVVDLAKLVVHGLPPARQKQDAPLLDNFEGLALGPPLPDGRSSLLVVSDDNGRTDQFARIVVLAVG